MSKEKLTTVDYIKWGHPILTDLSPHTIRTMVTFVYIINVMNVCYAIGMLIAAISIKRSVGDYLNMVTDGDGTVVPLVLLFTALASLKLNITTVILMWRLKGNKEPVRNRRFQFLNEVKVVNFLLFICVLFGACVSAVLLSGAIGSVVHSYRMHQRLHDGIIDAMNRYQNDTETKIQVDVLQITFRCCGSRKYSEWFDTKWYSSSSVKVMDTHYDDTPFSCCSMSTLYPCVHHDVMAVGDVYAYAPETNLSIAEHGCHTVLLRHARSVAWKTALALAVLGLLHVLLFLLTRFIQTAYHHHRLRYTYTAWFIGLYQDSSS